MEQSATEKYPAADEKITSGTAADNSFSPKPPVQENRITQFNQKQDSASIELQKDKFEIVDQTMTISPDQSLPAQKELSVGNEFNSAVSLASNKSNKTAAIDKMGDAEPKPSPETTSQSRDENAQIETKESSSDKIKNLIAEMAASQSGASQPEQEGEVAPSKKTADEKITTNERRTAV